MKSKEQKYQEAIKRNMKHFKNISKSSVRCLRKAKHKIGIRQEDSRYDDEIMSIINTKNMPTYLFWEGE